MQMPETVQEEVAENKSVFGSYDGGIPIEEFKGIWAPPEEIKYALDERGICRGGECFGREENQYDVSRARGTIEQKYEDDSRFGRNMGLTVISHDEYQVFVDEGVTSSSEPEVITVRGLDNLDIHSDGAVLDEAFTYTARSLVECADTVDYLDSIGLTVDGVNGKIDDFDLADEQDNGVLARIYDQLR